MVWINKKSDKIEDLVNKCEIKTRISSTASYSAPLPVSAFQPPIATLIPIIYFGTADSWPVDSKIDQLTKMIQSLTLSIRTLESKAGISEGNSRIATALIAPSSSQPSKPSAIQRSDWPERVTKYFYYWTLDHYLKRHYSVF